MLQTNLVGLRSLKTRLMLWVMLPISLLIAVNLFVTYQNSSEMATLVQQQLLRGSAKMIAEQLFFSEESNSEISIPPAALEIFQNKDEDQTFYAVYSKDGRLLAGGDDLPPYTGHLQLEEEQFFTQEVNGKAVYVIALARALSHSASGDYVTTLVAQTRNGYQKFRNTLVRSTLQAHLVFLAITVVALFIALRWILQPLLDFAHLLALRKAGSLDKFTADDAPTELEPVIHALNDYADQCAQTLLVYEKFVSNTAHHLRTSFTIVATQLHFAKCNVSNADKLIEVIDSTQKTMSDARRLINQFLVLASVGQQTQDFIASERVKLAPLIIKVIEEMAPLAQQKGIELGVDSFDERIALAVRPHVLYEIFANLVDNAIVHMGQAGTVTILLCQEDEFVRFSVVDDGVGIDPNLRQAVFERFFRIDETRSNSSGLGLAIVKEICDALNANVALSTPLSGKGLQVDIYFPLILGS